MSPDWFPFGAPSLLNGVLMQIEYQRSGRYQDPDHFTLTRAGAYATFDGDPKGTITVGSWRTSGS